jgi:SAM-dependent methyltransferase
VPSYERFSAFYDAVMDDPGPRAARVARCIDAYLPGASSLLELGCGTGSILARLNSVPALTGLDRSPEMLNLARVKVPDARLVEGDMECFALDERFDVVICVFDSLNHLLTFDAWRSMFGAVHDHLVDGGLFIFDVNTVGELRRLGEEPPWVFDFEGGVAIMDVTFADDGESQIMSLWDIRIFEDLGSSRYRLHHEQIGELGVDLADIALALEDHFTLLEQVDEHDGAPTDESMKAYFCLRRDPSPDFTRGNGEGSDSDRRQAVP